MRKVEIIIKKNKIKNELKEVNEFIDWHNDFGKKINKAILILFIISVLMVIPFGIYYLPFVPVSSTLGPTLMISCLTGVVGAIGSTGVAILSNILLALNKAHLKNKKEDLVKEQKELTKLEEQNNLNNKKTQTVQPSYQKSNSVTSSYSYQYKPNSVLTHQNIEPKKVNTTTGYARKKTK